MIEELKKLRELTETLTGNGYLRDQTEEWEYALDAIPDEIFIINRRFEITFANKALSNRLYVSKKLLYGRSFQEAIFETSCRVLDEDWASYEIIKKRPFLSEVYVCSLKGWFDITRSPVLDKNNNTIGFICVLQDVTEKKRAIDQYRLMDENIGRGVWTLDTDLTITFINSASKELMGYEREEWIGHNLAEFTTKRDLDTIKKEVYMALSAENFEQTVFDTHMINKEGLNVPLQITARPIRDCSGKIVGFQGVTKVFKDKAFVIDANYDSACS